MEGFFDILHLGVFLILSPAFDKHFYQSSNPPPRLIDELDYALHHFLSILHQVFSRFHILLDGVGVSAKYVLDQMLAKFAAAAVFLGKNISGDHMGGDIDCFVFTEHLERILQESHPEIFGYYSRCLDHSHKYFVWTGPKSTILPRSEEFNYPISITELRDFPTHSIYDVLDATPPPLAHLSPPPNLRWGNNRNKGKNWMEEGKSPRGENFRVGGFFSLWNFIICCLVNSVKNFVCFYN